MSLSCFLNKVTHKPDNNKTERPFCFTSFILHEMLKKSGWQCRTKFGTHPDLHCNQWLILPYSGLSNERRKSLPSPSAASNQEEGFFKSGPTQPVPNFGNISPGDGPLPIRPYHAIIEGTDKWVYSFTDRKFFIKVTNDQLIHPL